MKTEGVKEGRKKRRGGRGRGRRGRGGRLRGGTERRRIESEAREERKGRVERSRR